VANNSNQRAHLSKCFSNNGTTTRNGGERSKSINELGALVADTTRTSARKPWRLVDFYRDEISKYDLLLATRPQYLPGKDPHL
jgi:hypothetical protein